MQTINYDINQRIAGAIRQLRKKKHQEGFPFMIIDNDVLPDNQAFMEYSDGHIELVEFTKNFDNYTLLKKLSSKETINLREKYNLVDA